jgi:hypothetical protein
MGDSDRGSIAVERCATHILRQLDPVGKDLGPRSRLDFNPHDAWSGVEKKLWNDVSLLAPLKYKRRHGVVFGAPLPHFQH